MIDESFAIRRELHGTVTLKKSLREDFKEGDKFGLSITAHDGAITTRTEIVVFVEAAFHGDAPPVYPPSSTAVTTEEGGAGRPETTTTHFFPGITISDKASGEEDEMNDVAEK